MKRTIPAYCAFYVIDLGIIELQYSKQSQVLEAKTKLTIYNELSLLNLFRQMVRLTFSLLIKNKIPAH